MKIVTIHANGTSAKLMHPIEAATDHISLPGHDGVALEREYSLSYLREYVISLLGNEEVVLIGNSVGGMLAHQIADKINIQAIISIGIPPLNYTLLEGAMLSNEYVEIANTADITKEQMMTLSQGIAGSSPGSVDAIFETIQNVDPKVRSGLLPSILNGELRDELEILKNLNIPMLFIKCSDDVIVNNERFNDLPFGEVIELQGGHMLSMDNPLELNNVIKAFLSKHKLAGNPSR